MFALKVHLIQPGVYQRGLRLDVAKESLELFQRHPAAEAGSGERMTETVRVNVQAGATGDLGNDVFDRLVLQRLVRSPTADEQRVRIVRPCVQVLPQRDFGLRVEVNSSFLITFAVTDPDGPVLPTDV